MKTDSPLLEPLQSIGLDAAGIGRVLRQFPHDRIREWVDITLAARERFGSKFFKRSPIAYLIDNIKKSASDGRTPPDWWHDIRKAEERKRDAQARQQSMTAVESSTPVTAGRRVFEQIRNDLMPAYVASGLDDATALREASLEAKRRISGPTHDRSGSVPSAKDILDRLPLKLL